MKKTTEFHNGLPLWNPSATTLRRHFPIGHGVLVNGKHYGDVEGLANQDLVPGCVRVHIRDKGSFTIHRSKLARAL